MQVLKKQLFSHSLKTSKNNKLETGQAIVNYLNSQKSQFIADLEKFVMIESPSTEPAHIYQAYQYLIKQFEAVSYYTHWHPGNETGGYLYARPQSRKKHQTIQLMVGHIDTVWPLGTLADMPVVASDDKISGPGVYDMKAGIMQLIYALKTLMALDLTPQIIPVVLINSDEEIGSRESTPMIEYLAKMASRAFILEPSVGYDGKLKTRRAGVGKYTIRLSGKAAHAGLDPGKGASAIVELSHVIQKLFALNDPAQGVSVNVGMINGGIRPNVIAPESKAVVDVRIPTAEDAVLIDSQIMDMKSENPEVELSVEGGIGRPPMEGTPANRALWELAQSNAAVLDVDLMEATAGGGSDGNTTSQYTATLDGLGAIGDGAHATHEFAFQSKLIERSALLALLLLEGPIKRSFK